MARCLLYSTLVNLWSTKSVIANYAVHLVTNATIRAAYRATRSATHYATYAAAYVATDDASDRATRCAVRGRIARLKGSLSGH